MKIHEIYVSERAEKNLDNILEYLEEEWSEKVRKAFLDEITANFDRISRMPALFPKSEKHDNLRQALIGKHTFIFYQVFEEYIDIVTIQNTRQNPDFLV